MRVRKIDFNVQLFAQVLEEELEKLNQDIEETPVKGIVKKGRT